MAQILNEAGVRVFYDEWEKVSLWGKDLIEHLQSVFAQKAEYCVLFVSAHSAAKPWPTLERRSALARALENQTEYVLPARFDDTVVPGLSPSTAFIDLRRLSHTQFAEIILQKLGMKRSHEAAPENLDRLYEDLLIGNWPNRVLVEAVVQNFFSRMQRTNKRERQLVMTVMLSGCPEELPDNMHMSIDLLKRMSRIPSSRCVQILKGMESLGFSAHVAKHDDNDPDEFVYLEWHDYENQINATDIAV
ncbi:MAG TPA: TIR domain-containing protein, partial [Fimbriimonadaceae bacterium]|nr:TIR domain-containing protein [Fimbriimonadaceae bacterium]